MEATFDAAGFAVRREVERVDALGGFRHLGEDFLGVGFGHDLALFIPHDVVELGGAAALPIGKNAGRQRQNKGYECLHGGNNIDFRR